MTAVAIPLDIQYHCGAFENCGSCETRGEANIRSGIRLADKNMLCRKEDVVCRVIGISS